MSYEPTQPMTPPSTALTDPGDEGPGREDQDDPARDDAVDHETAQDDAGQDDGGQDELGQAARPEADGGEAATRESDSIQAAAPETELRQAIAPEADSSPVAASENDPDDVAPPEADVSQATIPRAVLSQADVPSPPGNAEQDHEPQSGWGHDSGPQGDWAAPDAPQDDVAQDGWGQRGGSHGDWDQGGDQWDHDQHGYEQQGYGQQPGYGPDGYAPQGYGPGGYGPQGDWDQGNAPRGYGPQDYGPHDGPPVRPRRRRRPVRWSVITLFVLLVLAIVAVIANFVGQAIAENDMANQFTANGFPVKPSVDIEGFPFLTQVAQKDFKKVVISAASIPAGPVTISSLNATITGMHLNSSWNGATIDHVTATAFISLSSLTGGISSELGDAASLTAVPDGPDKLKVTGTVLGVSASGDVEIKQTGPQKITVELPTSGGLVGTLLGSAPSFTITLPAGVPPSLRITGLTLNGQGLTVTAVATNATFSQ
jgi:hypothetical protein